MYYYTKILLQILLSPWLEVEVTEKAYKTRVPASLVRLAQLHSQPKLPQPSDPILLCRILYNGISVNGRNQPALECHLPYLVLLTYIRYIVVLVQACITLGQKFANYCLQRQFSSGVHIEHDLHGYMVYMYRIDLETSAT